MQTKTKKVVTTFLLRQGDNMDLMVNPQITGFRQDVDGTIKELKIGSNKEDAWANIAEQGASAKLDNNKAATINVSTYTEPVVVTPTSGKDGMKKATITLSNIPSPSGVTKLFAWGAAGTTTEWTTKEDGSGVCLYINENTQIIDTKTFDPTGLERMSDYDIDLA